MHAIKTDLTCFIYLKNGLFNPSLFSPAGHSLCTVCQATLCACPARKLVHGTGWWTTHGPLLKPRHRSSWLELSWSNTVVQAI